jgi:hypothetical protein
MNSVKRVVYGNSKAVGKKPYPSAQRTSSALFILASYFIGMVRSSLPG